MHCGKFRNHLSRPNFELKKNWTNNCSLFSSTFHIERPVPIFGRLKLKFLCERFSHCIYSFCSTELNKFCNTWSLTEVSWTSAMQGISWSGSPTSRSKWAGEPDYRFPNSTRPGIDKVEENLLPNPIPHHYSFKMFQNQRLKQRFDLSGSSHLQLFGLEPRCCEQGKDDQPFLHFLRLSIWNIQFNPLAFLQVTS